MEKERDTLLHDLETARREQEAASKLAEAKLNAELHKAASIKDAEIERLKARLDAGELSQKIAVTEGVLVVEKERDELRTVLIVSHLKSNLLKLPSRTSTKRSLRIATRLLSV
ncbi:MULTISPECIES: hypothetical protein [Brucella/Ochrobactrum group]|uniref:hypothetical protein n=1 Tax=Brucella/Ochrobactrum group TaxID=2826938 RepID=UPI001F3855A1|nr:MULTISPECIES: hypothetical protein [Brucella/Ochrobactrum group]